MICDSCGVCDGDIDGHYVQMYIVDIDGQEERVPLCDECAEDFSEDIISQT